MLHIWDLCLLKTNTNTHSRATNPARCGNSHGAQGMSQRTTPHTQSAGPVPPAQGAPFRGRAPARDCSAPRVWVRRPARSPPAEYRGESAQSAISACGAAPRIEFAQVGGEWEWEFKEGAERESRNGRGGNGSGTPRAGDGGTGAASERREVGAGGEQQVKAGATGYAVSKRGRATYFEAWVEGGDEQEAGKTALEACRNGRRRAANVPQGGDQEQAKYDEARAQSSPRWRQSSAYDPLNHVAPESAHGAAARMASRRRSEEAEEGPNEGPEWPEASGAQFAQKVRTGERA
ncbi:hypothetical protein DFH08DRAFT_1016763 [Mycena albidolilacea]|uniref:Uncharacterized protein n=1 Tax=Mycena albidolilacea TaxID=1033008 RepID=A0AAD7AP57_9AGAR|nr:hypothetical protein DFH08DRAFT_1016763 [Mycena albidolilacea]